MKRKFREWAKDDDDIEFKMLELAKAEMNADTFDSDKKKMEVDKIIKESKRKRKMNSKKHDPTHVCTIKCKEKNFIEELDKELKLYICDEGGIYHVCMANSECKNKYVGGDKMYYCIFSDILCDIELVSTVFGKAKFDTFGGGGSDEEVGYEEENMDIESDEDHDKIDTYINFHEGGGGEGEEEPEKSTKKRIRAYKHTKVSDHLHKKNNKSEESPNLWKKKPKRSNNKNKKIIYNKTNENGDDVIDNNTFDIKKRMNELNTEKFIPLIEKQKMIRDKYSEVGIPKFIESMKKYHKTIYINEMCKLYEFSNDLKNEYQIKKTEWIDMILEEKNDPIKQRELEHIFEKTKLRLHELDEEILSNYYDNHVLMYSKEEEKKKEIFKLELENDLNAREKLDNNKSYINLNLYQVDILYSHRVHMIKQTDNALISIQEIIKMLLFDQVTRKKINSMSKQKYDKIAINSVTKYYLDSFKKKKRPVIHTADDIYDHFHSKYRELPIIEENKNMIEFLSAIILDTWFLVISTKFYCQNSSRFDVIKHTIGMLYIMKNNFSINISMDAKERKFLLVYDAIRFLDVLLPPKKDIYTFRKLNQSKIKINDCFNVTIKAIESIPLDIRLPALTELSTRFQFFKKKYIN